MDRGRVIEIVAPIVVVGLFVVVLVMIGQQYNTDGLTPEGGLALVAAIWAFVLVMAALGLGFARKAYQESTAADE